MPIGVRLKKSVDTRPKIFGRKAKEGAGDLRSADRRKQGGRGNAQGSRNEYPEDSSEPNRRERRWEDKSNSSFKGRSGSFDSEFARHNKKRFDDSRDFNEGRRSQGFRAPNRRSFDSEEKHDRKDTSFDSRGRASGVKSSREWATNVKRRDVVFYESDVEETSGGSAREVRGCRPGDARLSRKGASNGRPRKFADDESEGASDGAAFAVRGGRTSDLRFSMERPAKGRKRSFEDNEYDVDEIGDGAARAARGRRGRMDDNHGAKGTYRSDKRGNDSYRTEQRGSGVEEAAKKIISKGKKRDGLVSADKFKGEAPVGLLEKHGNVKDKLDQIAEQKPDAHQAKKVDKSGKRVDTPPKKRKRIKLDPYDISNKRMDDDSSNNENLDKAEEKEIEISKNARFRAIQPSPSILSFVEDNLVGRRRLIELRKAGYNIKLSAPLDNVPLSTSTERERIEENVFRNKLEFFAAAKISTSFPPPLVPEIAFAGRSNVGKSSLLNALTRQWGVVRTSDKPGYTQSINFFRLASKLCLVDLPGYGFAYAKEEVKDAWEELVKEYVSTRVGLQRVCLLIDTKWGMKPRDYELIDLMERSDTPYQIVLTKTDAVFPIDVARRAMQIQENLKTNKSNVNPLMMVSSKSGAGIRSLRTVIAKLARFIKP